MFFRIADIFSLRADVYIERLFTKKKLRVPVFYLLSLRADVYIDRLFTNYGCFFPHSGPLSPSLAEDYTPCRCLHRAFFFVYQQSTSVFPTQRTSFSLRADVYIERVLTNKIRVFFFLHADPLLTLCRCLRTVRRLHRAFVYKQTEYFSA